MSGTGAWGRLHGVLHPGQQTGILLGVMGDMVNFCLAEFHAVPFRMVGGAHDVAVLVDGGFLFAPGIDNEAPSGAESHIDGI